MITKQCSLCKKILTINDFYKNLTKKDKLSSSCKNCVKSIGLKYNNTEKGYISNLYRYLKKREFDKRFENYPEEEKAKRRCYVTKEQFFTLWEEHKKRYGYTCALTRQTIFFKTSTYSDSKVNNGISVDRLNPNIGYTLENIVFVANRTNQMKCNVTKELCIGILKAYEERNW
jgi:hypothetical protein